MNTETKQIKDISVFLSKSKRPASYGKPIGNYKFFTLSNTNKFCDEFDYEDECLILCNLGKPIINCDKQFSCSVDNYILKFNDTILTKYLYYYFKININELESGFSGNAMKRISKNYIENMVIQIPSLENQRKIIDRLDIYFAEDSYYKFDLDNIMKYVNGNELLNHIFNDEWKTFLECVQKAQELKYNDDMKINKILSENFIEGVFR